MSEILSPSPYDYLDDLHPGERQAAIRMRQHRANAESGSAVDLARRARDYQARIAELEAALEPFAKFSDMLERQPIQGNGGILYALHMGTEDQAVLYEKDCHAARAALRNRN